MPGGGEVAKEKATVICRRVGDLVMVNSESWKRLGKAIPLSLTLSLLNKKIN